MRLSLVTIASSSSAKKKKKGDGDGDEDEEGGQGDFETLAAPSTQRAVAMSRQSVNEEFEEIKRSIKLKIHADVCIYLKTFFSFSLSGGVQWHWQASDQHGWFWPARQPNGGLDKSSRQPRRPPSLLQPVVD